MNGESAYLQELLQNQKINHSKDLAKLHERLDPNNSVAHLTDPDEIINLICKIIDVYVEKLNENDERVD